MGKEFANRRRHDHVTSDWSSVNDITTGTSCMSLFSHAFITLQKGGALNGFFSDSYGRWRRVLRVSINLHAAIDRPTLLLPQQLVRDPSSRIQHYVVAVVVACICPGSMTAWSTTLTTTALSSIPHFSANDGVCFRQRVVASLQLGFNSALMPHRTERRSCAK